VVRLFQEFLGRLHQSAVDEHFRREAEAKPKKRASRPRAKAGKRAASTPVLESPSREKLLTKMLVRMVTLLDVSQDVQCELLEGILCSLLDHIGSSLSLLVFSDPRSTKGDGTVILPPTGLSDTAHMDPKAAVGTAKAEGPYLVFVLRNVVEFLHSNVDRMSQRSLSLFSLQQARSTGSKDVRRAIEETLQRTLLRGVFGDDDLAFYDSLRRDEGVDEQELAEMVDEMGLKEDPSEWIIGQLWEHLGWDILSGNMAT
jgi:hypothetical protein